MTGAPFDIGLAEGPEPVEAHWVTTSDNIRLRVAIWRAAEAIGTILIFPGRTEYVEKYGRVAAELVAAGYSVTAIDWRGQGHADRLMDDPRLGHVDHFDDYQKDVAAYVALVDEMGLPSPRFLIAHSMGGAIGLRALINGLRVKRAVFSAPMWGIYAPRHIKSFALTLLFLATQLKLAHMIVPGTQVEGHVTGTSFEENKLTSDREQYAYILRQSRSDPALSLGGPTFHWLREARTEITRLQAERRPILPTKVFLGTRDPIVDRKTVRSLVESWPTADLVTFDGGKHELMIEVPEIRDAFMEQTLAFLAEA